MTSSISQTPMDDMIHGNSHQDASSTMDSLSRLSLPPAHYQFLPAAHQIEYAALKGFDHRRHSFPSCDYEDDSEFVEKEPSSPLSLLPRNGPRWLSLGFPRRRVSLADVADKTNDRVSSLLPNLVRSTSGSSLSSQEDNATQTSTKKRGVSFHQQVAIVPIPHVSTLPLHQRQKMYSSSNEVRLNKIRNKKEFRYDGCNWRNCTEEWEMSVCMVTGELIHPAHPLRG